mgnify:FL=1
MFRRGVTFEVILKNRRSSVGIFLLVDTCYKEKSEDSFEEIKDLELPPDIKAKFSYRATFATEVFFKGTERRTN